MRNILKATTLESKLPLLAVEHGCIISKDADVTVAFEVSLPELFTVTSVEYEALHSKKRICHFLTAHLNATSTSAHISLTSATSF